MNTLLQVTHCSDLQAPLLSLSTSPRILYPEESLSTSAQLSPTCSVLYCGILLLNLWLLNCLCLPSFLIPGYFHRPFPSSRRFLQVPNLTCRRISIYPAHRYLNVTLCCSAGEILPLHSDQSNSDRSQWIWLISHQIIDLSRSICILHSFLLQVHFAFLHWRNPVFDLSFITTSLVY